MLDNKDIEQINKLRYRLAVKNARNTIDFFEKSIICINDKGNFDTLKISKEKYSEYERDTIKSISKWHNVVSFIVFRQIGMAFSRIVALKGDGTVVSSADCYKLNRLMNKNKEIIAISGVSSEYLIALKKDGTVGDFNDGNFYGQCEVSSWKDIISISASATHTVGLKSDGTVVSTYKIGKYPSHEYKMIADDLFNCLENLEENNIQKIALTLFGKYDTETIKTFIYDLQNHLDNMKRNGIDKFDKKEFLNRKMKYMPEDYCVDSWKGIVAVKAGNMFTVALNSQGQLVVSGNIGEETQNTILSWTNLSDFYICGRHIYGIKKNGQVVTTNKDTEMYCAKLSNINEIFVCGEKIVAIKKDNSIISNIDELNLNNATIKFYGENLEELLNYEAQNTVLIEEKLKEEKEKQAKIRRQKRLQKKQEEEERKRKERIIADYKNRGVCQYCGGTFKGIFTKKCSQCGRNKDY